MPKIPARQRITMLLFENGFMEKDQYIEEMFDSDYVANDISVMRGDIQLRSIIDWGG